jgi:hypothetical protein
VHSVVKPGFKAYRWSLPPMPRYLISGAIIQNPLKNLAIKIRQEYIKIQYLITFIYV